jgi:hypothetical protein
VNQKNGSKIMPIRGGVGKTESGTRGPMNHHHETESGSHVDLMRHSRSLIFVLMRHSRSLIFVLMRHSRSLIFVLMRHSRSLIFVLMRHSQSEGGLGRLGLMTRLGETQSKSTIKFCVVGSGGGGGGGGQP